MQWMDDVLTQSDSLKWLFSAWRLTLSMA